MKHAWGDGTFSCTAAHTQMPKLHGLPATSTFFMANEAPMVCRTARTLSMHVELETDEQKERTEMVSPKVL